MKTDDTRGATFRGVPQKFEHTFDLRFTVKTHVKDPYRLSEMELLSELLQWTARQLSDYESRIETGYGDNRHSFRVVERKS